MNIKYGNTSLLYIQNEIENCISHRITGNVINHGLNSRPLLAFAVCYLAAHYVLDLIDDREAENVLDYCKEHMD
jgi:hypothetical protein